MCEEEDTVDIEELQTLLDHSNKHFSDSEHTAKPRENLAAEKNQKRESKPLQAQISNAMRRLEKEKKGTYMSNNERFTDQEGRMQQCSACG